MNISIRGKIVLFFVTTVIVLLSGFGYSFYIHESTVSKTQQIRSSTAKRFELTQDAELNLSRTITAWKSVLLHGQETGDYHRYLAEFYEHERQTANSLQVLHESLQGEPRLLSLAEQLIKAHREGGRIYREAIRVYHNEDSNAHVVADRFVQQIKVDPAEILTEIVALSTQLRDQRLNALQREKSEQDRLIILSLLGVVSIATLMFLWLVDRNVGQPAAQAITLGRIIDQAQQVAKFGSRSWGSKGDDTYWSSGVYRILGTQQLGTPSEANYLSAVHPSDRAELQRTLDSALRGTSGYEIDYRLIDADGNEHVIQERGQTVIEKPGGTVRVVAIIYDITDRKQAEEQLRSNEAALRRLHAITSSQSLKFQQKIRELLEMGAEQFGLPIAILSRIQGERYEVVETVNRNGAIRAGDVFELGQTYCSETLKAGGPIYFEKASGSEWRTHTAYQNFQREAYIGVPLILEDKTYGTLNFSDPEPREVAFSANDIEILKLMGQWISGELEREQAEEALRNSEGRFRTLATVSPVGIFRTDAGGECVYVNERWADIAGLDVEQARGRGWAQALHPDDRDAVFARWTEAANENRPFTSEYRFRRPDGKTTWVFGQAVAERDANGEITGYVGTVTDITERKRFEVELQAYRIQLEEKVRERTAALEASNRELESYSYSIAHDLRAPLRSVTGFTQILNEELYSSVTEEQKDYLRRVIDASKYMAELIDDILELSRITRASLHRSALSLTDLAREILKQLQSNQPQREVEFEIQSNLHVNGDPNLVRLLMSNILENAWKYTAKVNEPRIVVGVTKGNEEAIFYVKDNGVGFDMSHADQIFKPFHRLHRYGEYEGTGVGLATVQRVVHRHHGRVWAEAKQNQGTAIYFTLGREEQGDYGNKEVGAKEIA